VTRRTVAPEATWARVQPLLPMVGITRVGMLTGLDTLGIPVAAAYRPASRALCVSQGKGLTPMAARVGAVMEAVEGWAAERMTRDLKVGSYRALSGMVACTDPATLPYWPGKRPIAPDEPLIWCEAQEVGTGRACWVPWGLVHTMYTPGGHVGPMRLAETTRGLAAGNDRDECLSHALNELIEGHANAVVRALPDEALAERRVDLDTVGEAACRWMIEACARAKVDLLVIDSTTEIGIASFQAVMLDREDQPWRMVAASRGMGCHPDRDRALCRALSEAAQSRVTMISGSRDDKPRSSYDETYDPQRRDMIRAFCKGAARPYSTVPTRTGRTALDDATTALVALQRAGYQQALYVDCTQDARLPVLRVIVPGLLPEPRH
jgi:YcaO-like protein with predicted kinase domain